MKFKSTIPILRIFDEAKARAFYVDYLAFEVDWEHRVEVNAPLYLQLSKGDCILHLSENHGDGTPGTKIRIECDDVKLYHQQLSVKPYRYYNPAVEEQPWGAYEMRITDPFGSTLIFFTPIVTSSDA